MIENDIGTVGKYRKRMFMMKYNILIWGTGDRTKSYIERGYFSSCNIMGFVDSYKKNDEFMNCGVYFPEEINEKLSAVDHLVICTEYFEDILEKCMNLKVDLRKIVLTDNIQTPFFKSMFLKLKGVSEELFYLLENEPIKLVKINESDRKDEDRLMGKQKYNSPVYEKDYFRYRTFEFAAREILKNEIFGEVAELGVFRGTFSSMINEVFKEKKLYLFDTFEGFESEEALDEILMGRCDENFVSVHKNTSAERMLGNLPYPKKCVVCKGVFPDSITEEAAKERFSFVSIDVDFEESTYQGLKFFYPRLTEGGMIFVHDYNTFFLEGVKKAVDRFEKETGSRMKKLPLADRAGTLVIIK